MHAVGPVAIGHTCRVCWSRAAQKLVAIKTMERIDSAGFMLRTLREIRLLRHLRHENVRAAPAAADACPAAPAADSVDHRSSAFSISRP